MFVKVEMRVLFEDITHADYYREEAEKIEVDSDSDDECFENSLIMIEKRNKKRRFLKRADELEREELPSTQELFQFLIENDECMSKSRFEEMIDVCVLWHPTYNSNIYVKNDEVMISFVIETDPNSECSSIDEVEDLVNSDPFEKSRTGGRVGNYCKFPSRNNKNDLLGELDVDAFVTRVTDITGETKLYDPDDDGLEDIDLDEEVDIDEPEPKPLLKKTNWIQWIRPRFMRSK